jgi:molecular chaperone GrpE
MTARMSNENQTPETEDAELNAEADAAQAADAEAQEAPASEEPDPAEEISNLKDQLLRALAEMENTKKRAEREVKDTRAYAVTGFARDMLDVADNLSRALQSISDEAKSEAGEALKTLLEGVEMTERRLLSSLERHGVKKVEPAPGDALDPNMHQAAAQIPG